MNRDPIAEFVARAMIVGLGVFFVLVLVRLTLLIF